MKFACLKQVVVNSARCRCHLRNLNTKILRGRHWPWWEGLRPFPGGGPGVVVNIVRSAMGVFPLLPPERRVGHTFRKSEIVSITVKEQLRSEKKKSTCAINWLVSQSRLEKRSSKSFRPLNCPTGMTKHRRNLSSRVSSTCQSYFELVRGPVQPKFNRTDEKKQRLFHSVEICKGQKNKLLLLYCNDTL